MNSLNIKLCVFDVDGVLVNSRALHFPATQHALAEYGCTYSRDEDEAFGTIPTRQKLHLLAEYDRINASDIDAIWELKDDYACELFEEKIVVNTEIKPLFKNLKDDDLKIALASNARYSFLNKVIDKLDVEEYVDLVLSAQSVTPKPDPAIYLKAMKTFNISPKNTLIFEVSEVGKKAAYASGASVFEVSSYDQLTRHTFQNNETYCTSR